MLLFTLKQHVMYFTRINVN